MVEITHVVVNQVPPRRRAGGVHTQRISPQNTISGLTVVRKHE